MLSSVLWQVRAAWRRDRVRTSWSLGAAAPGLDGARAARSAALTRDPDPAGRAASWPSAIRDAR